MIIWYLYYCFIIFNPLWGDGATDSGDHECWDYSVGPPEFSLCAENEVIFIPQSLVIQRDRKAKFYVNTSLPRNSTIELELYIEHTSKRTKTAVKLWHNHVLLNESQKGSNPGAKSLLTGKEAIKSLIIRANCTSPSCDVDTKNYIRVDVVNSVPVLTLVSIVGWIYFAAWTISFWPQIIQNHQRRSVIGLDFNFIALNLTGFACYSVFNCSLFWSDTIQKEYFRQHPYGVNPIQINDIFFSLHALFATALTAAQCFVFERGAQRVSRVCILLLVAIYTFIFISAILGGAKVISWLAFIEYLSGVKLGITLIKYIPQLWLNFRRKSTEGWSIGNVLLDFTGGSFSVLQMLLIAYCYDDWSEIFGDFTKFGLGAISLTFDILFVIQHYLLYPRHDVDLYGIIHHNDQDTNTFINPEAENIPELICGSSDSGIHENSESGVMIPDDEPIISA